eukprot:SAG31_NODE_384_length_16414_cov_7.492308_7_plen_193_part_00
MARAVPASWHGGAGRTAAVTAAAPSGKGVAMVAAADVAVALLPLCAGACASAALMMPATAAQPLDPFRFAGRAAPGMEWFKEAKLGLFMHWGPVSQWGAEISFPLVCNSLPCHPAGPATCGERRCLLNITTTEQLAAHRQAYADLATTWDPVEFDARKMARLAKAAGFKYLIYTTVHCDGAHSTVMESQPLA